MAGTHSLTIAKIPDCVYYSSLLSNSMEKLNTYISHLPDFAQMGAVALVVMIYNALFGTAVHYKEYTLLITAFLLYARHATLTLYIFSLIFPSILRLLSSLLSRMFSYDVLLVSDTSRCVIDMSFSRKSYPMRVQCIKSSSIKLSLS